MKNLNLPEKYPSPPKNILTITEITSITLAKSQLLPKKSQPLPIKISSPPPPPKNFSNLTDNYSTLPEKFTTTLEISQPL